MPVFYPGFHIRVGVSNNQGCPLPFPLAPFHHHFPFPTPSPPLEVGPLNWGKGSGAEPQPKLNLVHFSLKIRHLVGTNLMIFLRIKWPNFKVFSACMMHPARRGACKGTSRGCPGAWGEGGKQTSMRSRRRKLYALVNLKPKKVTNNKRLIVSSR